jgi:hypothetical protein
MARPAYNFLYPASRPLQPAYWPGSCWQLTVGYQAGFKAHGYQADDSETHSISKRRVNPLAIYQNTQNIISAFSGTDAESPFGQIATYIALNNTGSFDGNLIARGHIHDAHSLMYAIHAYFPHDVSLGLFIPWYSLELSHVTWHAQQTVTAAEQQLINNLLGYAHTLGGLDLYDWKRSGCGDMLAQVRWQHDFAQRKPLLKNVLLQARGGISCPTGLKSDENRLIAFPFGNDGSWGIEMAGGLELTFGNHVKGGLDADFLYLIGNTRNRRIKIESAQTDLLLLNKTAVYRSFGLGQEYNIWLDINHIVGGLSLKLDYQYLKRNDDKFFIGAENFDPHVVNDAENLQEWTMHTFFYSLDYNLSVDRPCARFQPYVSLFGTWGFNGKRAIPMSSCGISFSASF